MTKKKVFIITILLFCVFLFVLCSEKKDDTKTNKQNDNANVNVIENKITNNETIETNVDKKPLEINSIQDYLLIEYPNKKLFLNKTGNFYSKETFETDLPTDYYIVYYDEKNHIVREIEIKNKIAISTIAKTYYDTGELLLKAEFGENNIPIKAEYHNKNSIIIKKEIYLKGKLKLITINDDNGKKVREENYSEGLIQSAMNYANGTIVKEERYNENGKPDGWWIYRDKDTLKIKEELYENGQISEIVSYIYNHNKQKIKEEIFKNGKLAEYFTYTYQNRKIIQERYVRDETKTDENVFILMDRIVFED